MIYRVFTESTRAPFYDLQDFYIVKPGPLFRFTGFLTESSQAHFFDLQGFYRVESIPVFRFTGFLQGCANIYNLFTGSKAVASTIYMLFTGLRQFLHDLTSCFLKIYRISLTFYMLSS